MRKYDTPLFMIRNEAVADVSRLIAKGYGKYYAFGNL
jgi:hypothetical protein